MTTAIATVVAAALGALGVWVTSRAGRKSTQQTVDQRDSEVALAAWQSLLTPYQDAVASLRVEVADLRGDVDKLRNWRVRATDYIRKLVKTMRDHGLEPPGPPADLELDPDD